MSPDPFEELREARARGRPRGLYSVCSSHPLVLEAAVRRAARSGLPVLVEATANQVNQEGGYTGMRPADFAARLAALRDANGVPEGLVVFGGDHLGPFPWRALPAEAAMDRAEALVRAFAAAGARKIHLDASMALGGDAGPAPDPAVAAARAARLCASAEGEARSRGLAPPVYVIGTEVPVPGGAKGGPQGESDGPVPTDAGSFAATAALHEAVFREAGLGDAWRRVIAVVVQPGVEFDSEGISPYRRERAAGLARALRGRPGLFFEGHSTDYQSDSALRELVEDGFAFLKVGPALTFAFREAIFGLSSIEAELSGRPGGRGLPEALVRAMRDDDRHWRGYCPRGDATTLSYSLSDRSRYYWDRLEVAAEVERLFGSLAGKELPPGLLSQYLPRLGGAQAAVALGGRASPRDLVVASVDAELARYEAACFPGAGSGRAGGSRAA